VARTILRASTADERAFDTLGVYDMVDDQARTAQFPVRQAIPAPPFLCGDLFQALHQDGFVYLG
jgi:hypothetical protein